MTTKAFQFAPRTSGDRVRRVSVGVIAAVLMGALLLPNAAGAANKPTKVDVCHATGGGTFKKLNVSENAVPAHLEHGDGTPGGSVPGMPGYVFSSGCVPADVTPPLVTVPADQTVAAASTAGAAVTFAALANDAVDGPLTATCNPTSGSTFLIGETTVTCTAIDASGNTGSASFKITVEDFVGDGWLVRALSTDSSGSVRIISELLDTNRDGVPSTGDTAKFYEYPKDFAGTSYGTFETSDIVLADVYYADTPERIFILSYSPYGSEPYHYIQWYVDPTFIDFFGMDSPGESVRMSEICSNSVDCYDQLSLRNSSEDISHYSTTSPADDAFVDVVFNLTP